MCRKKSMRRPGRSKMSRRSALSSSSLSLSPSSSCSTAEQAKGSIEAKEPSMARLDGRVAILTGGAEGSEVAAALARDYGANSVESAVTDVSDEGAVAALVARTMERFGKIDILVNNAALFAPLQETKCTEIDVATWDRVMAINLRGPFLLVKHVAPH